MELFKSEKFQKDVITARTKGGITTRQLEAATGLPIATFYRIEAGQIPDVAKFALVCRGLGLNPADYFTDTKKQGGK